MNEMIINILTVGPSSIEITLPTFEMISLKNYGLKILMFFTSSKCVTPLYIVGAICLLNKTANPALTHQNWAGLTTYAN